MKTIDERIAEAKAREKALWEEYKTICDVKSPKELAHDAWISAVCDTANLEREKRIREEIAREEEVEV